MNEITLGYIILNDGRTNILHKNVIKDNIKQLLLKASNNRRIRIKYRKSIYEIMYFLEVLENDKIIELYKIYDYETLIDLILNFM